MKVCFGQDAGYFLPLVPLNLNLPILNGAAGTTSALHQFSQLFFFGQANPNKVFDQRDRLAASSGLYP